MSETFDELVERWGEAMAGRAEPLTPLERALVNHGVEDAYLEYAALRAELALKAETVDTFAATVSKLGQENERLREIEKATRRLMLEVHSEWTVELLEGDRKWETNLSGKAIKELAAALESGAK